MDFKELLDEKGFTTVLSAIYFASKKHIFQLRKDGVTPYINHPIDVAHTLWLEGHVRNPNIIAAAILHDTIEDTDTSPEEIRDWFGDEIHDWVMEVSDNKFLPKEERRRLQIIHAPLSSDGAKQIKIADKICNIRDLMNRPPKDWSQARKRDYLEWSDQVVVGLRSCNDSLEKIYDETVKQAQRIF